eukprot:g12578.t1
MGARVMGESTKHAVATRGLTKVYSGKPVVNALDLRIPAGCVYGLLGRNGAGKSTAIKMLTGMVIPDAGEADLLGENSRNLSAGTRARVAYIAEGHPLYPLMSIGAIERFVKPLYPKWNSELFEQILDHFELPRKRRILRLSRGQRAQAALALALAPEPELLILDDPTLGLDTVVRREFLESMIQIIQREGRTILFSSHILGDVERVADRIGILVDGVLRALVVRGANPYSINAASRVFDLDGRRVDLTSLVIVGDYSLRVGDSAELQWQRPRRIGARSRRISTGLRDGSSWHLLFGGNRSSRFCFAEVNAENGDSIGFIGTDGFQKERPDESGFFEANRSLNGRIMIESGGPQVWLVHDRQLLSVDFADRKVQRVIDETVISIDRGSRERSEFASRRARNDSRQSTYAVRTQKRIDILEFSRDGFTKTSIVIPRELRDTSFRFYRLQNREVAYSIDRRATPDSQDEKTWTRPGELIWATDEGVVVRRRSYSLSVNSPGRRGLSEESQRRMIVASIPSTLGSMGIAFGLIPWFEAHLHENISFVQALGTSAGESWWVVVLMTALSGWLARLAYRHQQDVQEPDGWYWAAYVFLFGAPGYVGYRLHRQWPYRLPIPPPEPTGLEVFVR